MAGLNLKSNSSSLEVAKASFPALGASFEFILNQHTQKVEVGQVVSPPPSRSSRLSTRPPRRSCLSCSEMLIVTHRSWVGELTKVVGSGETTGSGAGLGRVGVEGCRHSPIYQNRP